MGRYGDAAIRATQYYLQSTAHKPEHAWEIAVEPFESRASREKSCPRCAFLALCEEGLIDGIPRGKYTKSKANKTYAILAYLALISEPHLAADQDALCVRATGARPIRHNEQMDVVSALWRNGLIHP